MTKLHGSLLRTALAYVRDRSAAEDVVQETWLGFLNSLDRFEGRCSVRTWLFRILFNKAQSRATADRRLVPFATLARREASACWEPYEASSAPWSATDRRVGNREILGHVEEAIAGLPRAQATVIWMRDVEGMASTEVCASLGISPANQRVLLHRARSRVRQALEGVYGGEPCTA